MIGFLGHVLERLGGLPDVLEGVVEVLIGGIPFPELQAVVLVGPELDQSFLDPFQVSHIFSYLSCGWPLVGGFSRGV